MIIAHYSSKLIKKLRNTEQVVNYNYHTKPLGLWISIEDGNGWKECCDDENYNQRGFKHKYSLKLKKDSTILHLKTSTQIREFSEKYGITEKDGYEMLKESFDTLDEKTKQSAVAYFQTYFSKRRDNIDWITVAEEYQGIIIAPYQFDCRLETETSWYYGWDCSSGCIWDVSCVESFKKS